VRGPNHIAGGVVYTGVFSSFWDVNIFSNPWYISATIFFALLPDIDHPRSTLGGLLAFTKLPKYLDVNYGHRTITHSLLAYFVLGFLIYFFETILSPETHFTMLFFFAFSSHLLFDMMTVSGVPLLYPWKKNPFVVPGNPDYRFRTADLKSEAYIFVAFCCVFLFCIPLFKNGFWTTYNRQFGTLNHLFREYSESEDLLKVEYDFLEHGEQKTGNGIVLHVEPTKCFILTKDSIVIEISDKTKIEKLLPEHIHHKRREKEKFFLNIDYDSLRTTLRSKAILEAEFQSSTAPLEYTVRGDFKTSKVIKIGYDYNPFLELNADTNHAEIRRKIEIKNIEIAEIQAEEKEEKRDLYKLKTKAQRIENRFDSMKLSEQENAVKDLKKLRLKIDNYTFSGHHLQKLFKQLEHLKQKLNEDNFSTFSGKLVYLELPKEKP